ncbi:YHS domain-containing (seleno)protein [Psychromonas ossibalaenae]|uniref:YHS domain-containing (seleno)protein n=1 Tax=Psychromonas ossibalaenae TaxID=444922 RepID=UPI00036B154E|nr:YHS domain-containing (seleno)protein [Psychromonas ossibalaenae]
MLRIILELINFSIKTVLFLLFISTCAVQAQEQISTGYFNNKAVSGFDVVAYFTVHKPLKGSSDFIFEYKGADWYFSSRENLRKFKNAPENYAPQYGGYCTWAMSQNKIAPGDPSMWLVYKNKLYLTYAQSGLDKLLADKDRVIRLADINWLKIEKQ